ncbi:MAG: BlaI/MecI/CopY family transcriptional regulator [Phycisphaerales bacterium]|nr:BlaI/MecI/CopY family transcriptional regulator [Phycisphaerales bacterium]
MTQKKSARKPTDAECQILNVIWRRGSATVREVYDDLSDESEIGYTTVLKFMQIMTDKGLLSRDTNVRPQIYKACHSQKKTQKTMVADLLDRAFCGSPGNLVLQALSMRKTTPEELQEIRDLVKKLERQQ